MAMESPWTWIAVHEHDVHRKVQPHHPGGPAMAAGRAMDHAMVRIWGIDPDWPARARRARGPAVGVDAAGPPAPCVDREIAVGAGHFYAWRTLEAMGVDPRRGAVRASLVHDTSADDVERLIDGLDAVLSR